MGLLKWRENPEDLEQLLRAFMFVDGEEIVKVHQDAFSSLCVFWASIIMNYLLIS